MEDTIEKDRYLQLREQMKPLQDKTWELMYSIGRENYPQEDVDMAWHLQNKIATVAMSLSAIVLCALEARHRLESAGRPGHLAAAEDVNVQMIDRLRTVLAIVDDEAIAVAKAERLRHLGRLHH